MPYEPYIGNVMIFAGNYAPAGWLFCDGSLLQIDQYDTLYNLIGTTYGGDGQTTFALPDLRGRAPIHQGQGGGLSNFAIGQVGGAEAITLTEGQMPAHTHLFGSGQQGTTTSPTVNPPATAAIATYAATSDGTMAADCVGAFGAGEPHENRQPYLVLNYVIAYEGIYPSQS